MTTEQFTSNGSKSITIEGVKEAPMEEINIKGKTVVLVCNRFGDNIQWNGGTGWTREPNTQIISFTPTLNYSTGNIHPIYFYADRRLQNYTTYTLNYRVIYADTERITMTKWNHGDGSSRLSLEPGYHSHTFTTGALVDNYVLYFNLTRNALAEDMRELVRIEFLGFTIGDDAIKANSTENFIPAGLEDKGIEVIVQNNDPVLGEYHIQGDIPGYLNYLEGKIVGNENTFDINWI